MLYQSYQLLGLLFAAAVCTANTSKPSFYPNTTSVRSSRGPTNSASSYGTISLPSVTGGSSKLSITSKHPHSKSSTATAPYPTDISSEIETETETETKTKKKSKTPTGTAFYSTGTSAKTKTKKTHTPTGSVYSTRSITTAPSTTPTTLPSTTSTPAPTCTPATFKLVAHLQYTYPSPPAIEGNAITLVPGENADQGTDIMQLTPNPVLASTFTLNADCTIQSGTEIGALPPAVADHAFSFYAPATIAGQGLYKIECQINNGQLSCYGNTGSYYSDQVFFTCGSGTGPFFVTFAPTQRPFQTDCYALQLLVVPV
jgi:hypothetical protein